MSEQSSVRAFAFTGELLCLESNLINFIVGSRPGAAGQLGLGGADQRHELILHDQRIVMLGGGRYPPIANPEHEGVGVTILLGSRAAAGTISQSAAAPRFLMTGDQARVGMSAANVSAIASTAA